MRSSLRAFGIAALGAGLCLSPGIAPAQEDGADSAGIEEIIVTARKREEPLQNVPLAITAFDEEAIERTYSTHIGDFTKYTPNVSIGPHPYTGNGLLGSIRGVSFRDLEKSFDPTVGVVIDGVPLGQIAGARIDAFDLESIEILRGPQGTLFGRNTVGGLVKVRRTRPTGEFGAKAGMRIGANQENDYKAVVNFPIVPDILSAKLAFFSENDESFAFNTTRNEQEEGTKVTHATGTFLFEPMPNLEALLTLEYYDDESELTPPVNLTAPTISAERIIDPLTGLVAPNSPFNPSDTTLAARFRATTARGGGALNNGGNLCDYTRLDLVNQAIERAFTPAVRAGVRMGVLSNEQTTAALAAAGLNPATVTDQELQALGQQGAGILAEINGAIAGSLAQIRMGVENTGCRANGALASQASGFSDTQAARPFINHIDASAATLEVNWDAGSLFGVSDVSLTSISSYRKSDELLDISQSGAPANLFRPVRPQDFEQWSQELRVSGTAPSPGFGGGIDFVAGLYYFHSEYKIEADSYLLGEYISMNPVVIAGQTLQSTRDFTPFGIQVTDNTSSQDADTYAIFGEATWSILEQLRLTAGFRWTYENKEIKIRDPKARGGYRRDSNGQLMVVTNPVLASIPNVDAEENVDSVPGGLDFSSDETWNELTPRVSLDYRLNQNLMFYGSYSRGFRSGGFVGRAVVSEDAGPFKTETVDTFELGTRTDWWGNRLRFNLTGFYTAYNDKQEIQLRSTGTTVSTFVENAADATLYGAEAELQLKLGNLNLYANGGWLETEYDDFVATCPAVCGTGAGKAVFNADGSLNPSQRDLSGLEIPGSPEFNYTVGADWLFPTANGNIIVSANYKWTDEFTWDEFPDPAGLNRTQVDDYGTADFSVTYNIPYADGRELSVGAFVKDAFHKDARISATINAGLFYFGSLAQGRTWGVEAAISF